MDVRNGTLIFSSKNGKLLHTSIVFESKDIMFTYCIPKYSHSYICNAYDYINSMKSEYEVSYRNPINFIPKSLKSVCKQLVGTLPENVFRMDNYMFTTLLRSSVQNMIIENYDAIQIGYILNKLNVYPNEHYIDTTRDFLFSVGYSTGLYGIYANRIECVTSVWKADCILQRDQKRLPTDIYRYIYTANDKQWQAKINGFIEMLDKNPLAKSVKKSAIRVSRTCVNNYGSTSLKLL